MRFFGFFLFLAVVYIGSYAFLVEPKPRTLFIHFAKEEVVAQPTYRYVGTSGGLADWAERVYRPLFRLDIKLRPDYWKPVFLG